MIIDYLNKNGLIVATKNKGKLKEISKYFEPYNINLFSLNDLEHDIEINENGTTFQENALKKAISIYLYTNKAVLADDSGLVVPELGGEPGVFSSRYSGDNANDQNNIEFLLNKLSNRGLKNPSAYFWCNMALLIPKCPIIESYGKLEGIIIDTLKGSDGFGYDPIFYIANKNKTVAEISLQEKNEISHRALALQNLLVKIKDINFEAK